MKKYRNLLIFIIIAVSLLTTICFIPFDVSKFIPNMEETIEKDLGIKVAVEKLVMRVGPFVKIKAPIIHLMYEDGQKFGQINNVKFYISWISILKNNIKINNLNAHNLIVRTSSKDEYLPLLLKTLCEKDVSDAPNIKLKEYSITYNNDDNIVLTGQNFESGKVKGYKNFKIKAVGEFSINDKKVATYDILFNPKFDLQKNDNLDIDFMRFISHLKELDFYADIIADLKLYKKQNDTLLTSGFINIDNMSVLDKERKNPKSYIYLTLLGDKASLRSNIYASANKKLYIDGIINNSKKLAVDIKVKSDEIQIADLYKKLKPFNNFFKIKDIEFTDGILKADFSLKGDLNKIKSNGFLRVSNAKILSGNIKIDKINSEIDFSNNSINIINTSGYVEDSQIIAKGVIDKNILLEVIMNKVPLKSLIPQQYGVSDGIMSLVVRLSGTLDNVIHKENLKIENLKIKKDFYDLAADLITLDTNKNNTAYLNNIQCKTDYTELIKIPSAKVFIDKDIVKLPDTKVYMPNSMLTVNGNIVKDSAKNIFSSTLNSKGYINSKDIKNSQISQARYPVNVNFTGNKDLQNLNAQVLLEKSEIFEEPYALNLSLKNEKNNVKIEDLSLSEISGSANDNFMANTKGNKKAIITGLIETEVKPVLKNVRLFIPQFINIKIGDTNSQIKADLFLNGDINSPSIVGQLLLKNLINHTFALLVPGGTMDFNNDIVYLNIPSAKISDCSTSIVSAISTDIREGLKIKSLNLKSKYINTNTLLMYKDNEMLKKMPVTVDEGKLYTERLFADIYGEDLYLTALSSDFEIKKNVLSLKNLSSELFNGKLSGAIKYNLSDESFNSKLYARNVSAAPIFDIISNRKDEISGTMDFDAILEGDINSRQNLSGDLKFIIHNGRLSTLGKLEHLLYAQNVVADNMLRTSLSMILKAVSLKDTGLFKYLRGEIALKNGIANIKMMQSQGPLMSLFIKGQYNTLNDYAKLVVLGRLSDEIISALGSFGDFSFNKLMIMLTGEENNSLVTIEDFDKLPQLNAKNTKEFRTVINGNIDKNSSIRTFNWVSYSKKSLKQSDTPNSTTPIPEFIEKLPY